jgi:hypothetical protein
VPGLGPVAVGKLAAKGVKTTAQLMGEFLVKNRSRKDFCTLLTTAAELRQQCAPAAALRCTGGPPQRAGDGAGHRG